MHRRFAISLSCAALAALLLESFASFPTLAAEADPQHSAARAEVLDSRLWMTEFTDLSEAPRRMHDDVEVQQLPEQQLAMELSPEDSGAAAQPVGPDVQSEFSSWEQSCLGPGSDSGLPAQSGPTLTTLLVATSATVVFIGSLLSPK